MATYAVDRDHANARGLPVAWTAVGWFRYDHAVGFMTNSAPRMQRQRLSTVGPPGDFETVVYTGLDFVAKPDLMLF
jgi:putative hydrolase of the HAD superfamily